MSNSEHDRRKNLGRKLLKKKQGHHYVDNLRHAIDKGKHDSIEIARHVSEDVSFKVKKVAGIKKETRAFERFIRLSIAGTIFGSISGVALFFMLYLYFLPSLPGHSKLQDYQPKISTRVHAGDGRLLAEFAIERRVFVPIEAIPDPIKQAFISAEDKNFYLAYGAGLCRDCAGCC